MARRFRIARLFRFSLRSLLLCMLLGTLPLVWFRWQVQGMHERQAILDYFREHNVGYGHIDPLETNESVTFRDWLHAQVLHDETYHVRWVSFDHASDENIEQAAKFPRLTGLKVAGEGVTDAGARQLSRMQQLR